MDSISIALGLCSTNACFIIIETPSIDDNTISWYFNLFFHVRNIMMAYHDGRSKALPLNACCLTTARVRIPAGACEKAVGDLG